MKKITSFGLVAALVLGSAAAYAGGGFNGQKVNGGGLNGGGLNGIQAGSGSLRLPGVKLDGCRLVHR
jgi:hypothetical protein